MFHQLTALLVKNYLLKKRSLLTTVCEIGFPLLVMCVMIGLRGVITIDEKSANLHVNDTLKWKSGDYWVFPNLLLMSYALADYYNGASAIVNDIYAAAKSRGEKVELGNFTSNPALMNYFYQALNNNKIAFAPGPSANITYVKEMAMEFDRRYGFLANGSITKYYHSSAVLEDYLSGSGYAKNNEPYILGAIVFQEVIISSHQYSYEIRLNASDRTAVNSQFTPFKNDLHWTFEMNNINQFVNNGYIFLQEFVENYILSQSSDTKLFRDLSFSPFPSPDYKYDPFPSLVGNLISLLYILSYLWPITQLVKSIVQEKETKIKEGMKMMGLSEASLYLSWLVSYVIIFGLTAILITLITMRTIYRYSNKGYIFLFFWLFGLSAFSFCYMISCFFSKARLASNVGAIGFIGTFLLYYAIGSTASSGTRTVACLSAPICFGMTVQHMAVMEANEVGIRASSVDTENDNFTFNTGIGMIILDFFLYTFIGLYFSRIIPGEYGLAESWYFCITPKFWFPERFATKSEAMENKAVQINNKSDQNIAVDVNADDQNDASPHFSESPHSNEALMEPVSDSLKANLAIEVRSLRKEFGTAGVNSVQVAVNNLSIDLYEGQIFVLLGHNGAGKTTTISMLTGMFPPTSGDAFIYGKPISSDMEVIRKQLGVCPQHNILFDELTVKEHLRLYASIKGIAGDSVDTQINEIINEVGLSDKVDVYSKSLSGGMQRKLSLAIALLGDSKTIFLDEPTSGMDPFSRRFTWDLLKKKKKGRAIILTTHFMDEADQLGDRIAIMHAGEIKCCGSSLFLKSKYGVGYTLTITKEAENSFDEKSVSDIILKMIPNSDLLSNVAGEISFRLPIAASSSFPALFDVLDSKQESFGISSYGISVTTLEEVFLRVGHDEAVQPKDRALVKQLSTHHQKELSSNNLHVPKDIPDDEPKIEINEGKKCHGRPDTGDMVGEGFRTPSPSKSGRERGDSASILERFQVRDIRRSMFFEHVNALLRKRAASAYRDRKTWVCTVVCPAILMLIGLIALQSGFQYTYPSIILSTNRFDNPNFIPFAALPPTDRFFLFSPLAIASVERNQFVNVPAQTNISFSFLDDDASEYRDRKAMAEYLFNSYPQLKESRYSAALSSAVYSPLLRSVDDRSTLYSNTTATYGVPIVYNYYNTLYLRWMTGNRDATITLIDHPMPSTKASRQLFRAMLSFFFAIAFSFVPIGFIAYVVKEESDKVKHQQLLSGVSNAAYWVSNYLWDYFNYLFPALLCLILLACFNVQEYIGENAGGTIVTLLFYGLSVIPFTYSLSFFFKNYVSAMIVVMIVYIFLSALLLSVSQVLDLVSPSTASVNKHLKFIYRIVPPFCFAESITNIMVRSSAVYEKERGLWDMDVLGWPIVYMTIESFLWFAFVLTVEKIRYTPKLLNKFSSNQNLPQTKFSDEDDDVVKESERLVALPDPTPDSPLDIITMKGLRKVYAAANGQPPKTALHSLHLGVPAGQCFGYLGINGAGKTTTMKMLSGDILPSEGRAFLNGFDIQLHQMEVRRLIGYCPQFDALIDTLTGREHLLLFARIKGVDQKDLHHYVEQLIKKIGLQGGIADKPTKGYSGGNKRKICVGIALIGNPPIVFLDEPSTGMDPKSRRSMWDLIASTMKNRSVILTTHSMEECEALCHRIGIMVGGRLRCVGTIQHLRQRFGADYQIDCHFLPNRTGDDHQGSSFTLWLANEFPGVRLLERHGDSIKARIPKEIAGKKISIANIFRTIEKEKLRLRIADYSVSETTLEQIFIHFARQQEVVEKKALLSQSVFKLLSLGNNTSVDDVEQKAIKIEVAAVGGEKKRDGY